MAEAITVKNLTKNFEYYKKAQGLQGSFKNLFHREKLIKEAVKGLNLEVEEGEFVGFLGPNGAGKTTSLKILSGILFPTSGDASVLGYTPWDRKKDFKRQISIVMGQKNQLWWDLPANESMILNQKIYDIDEKIFQQRLDEMSELLDVKDLLEIQVRRLSLGERMKMELIAALLHHPRILFLDEPTIGLDIVSQKAIREFLKYYNQQEKVTVLLTSHYMDDITQLCERSVVINHGVVIFDDLTENINQLLGDRKIVKFKMTDGEEKIYEVPQKEVNNLVQHTLESGGIGDFTVENLPIEDCIELLYKGR